MPAPRLVLVEGASDRIALTTLALRLGRDLAAEGVSVEPDLEDEPIRAVGEHRMLEVIDDNGGLASFRRLQHQPVQRTWTQHRQLHLFLSARSGNKARYAAVLAHAMPLDTVPRPLAELMTRM